MPIQPTVFVLVETWDRDGDRDGSPVVTVFSDVEIARKTLRELITYERETGLIAEYHGPNDPEDDWEFIDENDHFHAKSESRSIWIDFEIIEKTVEDKDYRYFDDDDENE